MTERSLQQLYQLPPERFTAARNQLAKELSAEGSRELASRVRAANRPTVAIWALNRIAREFPEELQALLDAGDRIRAAQASAVRGNRQGAGELRQASHDLQSKLAALIARGAEAIQGLGRAPSASVLGKIEATLRAAALNPGEGRQLLKEGILDRELQHAGFPGSAEISSAADRPERTAERRHGADRSRAADREALKRAREENKRAVAARRGAARDLRKWELRVRRSQTEAARRDEVAARLERSAAEAREKANRAKRRAEEDRRQLQLAADRLSQLRPGTQSD
jgi:hypothetical protein